jgi:hypothetical protein
LAAGTLWAASTRIGPLNAQRMEEGLTLEAAPKAALPSKLTAPLLAVGRAVLADVYWLMATRSKDQGRIFDAYQLAQRICELQPRFASVWAFQAWNMSYNISVTLRTPEERWRWVRNGYELLRDQGIPLNPNSTQLYKELAWILFHKVGDNMDEWHYYYKLQFALQMQDILGEPPADYVRPGRVEGDFYRDYDYKSLTEAPPTFAELVKRPGAAEFAEELRRFGFDAGESGIFLGLLTALRDGTARVPNAKAGEEETRRHELKRLMDDPRTEPARTALERFWRAQRLRNEVKLDPQRIVDLQTAYGISFDWRLPETHALYWANLGMEKGTSRQEAIDIHRLNTNRIEFYCMQKMFHRGRMAMSRNAKLGEPPFFSGDYRVIPILFDAYVRDSKEYLAMEKENKPVSENFRSGFVGFTRSAILRYHEVGMQKEGQELFDFLRENYPDPMYQDGLSVFLAKQFEFDRLEVDDYRGAIARVQALIYRGLNPLAYDEDLEAETWFARARQVYDRYHSEIVSERLRVTLPFEQILAACVHQAGGAMYRTTYEHVCAKLKITPLPAEGGQPATSRPRE